MFRFLVLEHLLGQLLSRDNYKQIVGGYHWIRTRCHKLHQGVTIQSRLRRFQYTWWSFWTYANRDL